MKHTPGWTRRAAKGLGAGRRPAHLSAPSRLRARAAGRVSLLRLGLARLIRYSSPFLEAPSIKRLSLFVFQDIIVYFLEYLFITNLTSVFFFFLTVLNFYRIGTIFVSVLVRRCLGFQWSALPRSVHQPRCFSYAMRRMKTLLRNASILFEQKHLRRQLPLQSLFI